LKSYFRLVFCIAFWIWNCMFSLQAWSFCMIETYNMFVLLVFSTFLWPSGLNRSVIEKNQIHDVAYLYKF
jgi:hypothetical protein